MSRDESRTRPRHVRNLYVFIQFGVLEHLGVITARRSHDLDRPGDPDGCRRAWSDAFAPFFDVSVPPADPASVALTRTRLGGLVLDAFAGPAQTLRRTPEMAAGPGRDGLLFRFQRDGSSRVTLPDGTVELGRLQGVLLDLAQPASIASDPGRVLCLVLPRALIADRVADVAALHGVVFDLASDRVARLLFTGIEELAACADALTEAQIPQVTQAVATLAVAALRCRDSDAASQEQRRGLAIRRFIQAELGAQDLCAETVAEHFGMSRSGLYRLFSDEGGVQRFIRERRLARAMALLAQDRAAGRPRVAAVAHACGFSDEKTFSRAFRRRFGLPPSAVGPAGLPWDEAGAVPVHRLNDLAA